MSDKKVRITVELDNDFIKMLRHNIQLGQTREGNMTAPEQLAVAVCAEAMGGYEEVVDAEIYPEWRPHLAIIHEERKVIE